MFNILQRINRCSSIIRNSDKLRSIGHEYTAFKSYATRPKRFYKNVEVVPRNGFYEIMLDKRKLKTPKGNLFKLDNEILALMVAQEWDAQEDEIQFSTMHLTALSNTSLENPNHVVKEEAVDKLLGYLQSDSTLHHSLEEELNKLQMRAWDPIIKWFNETYEVNVEPSTNLGGPSIPDESKELIRNHLLTYNLPSIHGFNLAVESLKSLILTISCVGRKITVEEAVFLSRLEEEYQIAKWGRIEWAHDLAYFDLLTRTAAGIVFIQLHSLSEETKSIVGLKLR